MEEFESPTLDSWMWLSSGSDKAPEKSEKQKESYKKAQAQIQKSQKDEKKAKGDNDSLFIILSRFIQNPYYEEIVPLITNLLAKTVPSRYIISIIALFYPEATIHVLNSIWRHDDINILLSLKHEAVAKDFNESNLDPTIRKWMSTWIYVSQLYITHADISVIMQNKLLKSLRDDEDLVSALSRGLEFFFASRNLNTDQKTMLRYARHITGEYVRALELAHANIDRSLLEDIPNIEDHMFFWLSRN